MQYIGRVSTEILQVRDVASDDLAVLRDRAARSGQSLSSYIRELLHDDARRPTNAEVVRRIADEEPIDATAAEIRDYISAERRG